MKAMYKPGMMILTILLVLSLGMAAFAEGAAETAPAADPAAAPDTAAASDAQASADALKEALTALENARADARRQAVLDKMKEELDAYVASGKLTQEQEDLILKYYTEQLTLQQGGRGRDGKGMFNGPKTRKQEKQQKQQKQK